MNPLPFIRPTPPSSPSEIPPSSRTSPPIATKLEELSVEPDKAEFLFPKPSGEFPIGIQSYVLHDADRSIAISIHYPSKQGTSFRHHPLEPYIEELGKMGSPAETARYASCSSYAQPDASPIGQSFPVVIMAHGFGMRSDDYQPIVEELSSHGFCVITVESQGVAGYSRALASEGKPGAVDEEVMPSDDQAVQLQSKDIEFVLNTLQDFGKINPDLAATMDLERTGVMGHSIGGATAAQVCRNNALVRAGMNFDGGLVGEHATSSIFQPFVTIQCDRAETVLENLIPDVKASLDLSREAKQLRDSGDTEKADAKELEAAALLEAGLKGAENFIDPIAEFDSFHARAGMGSYQVVLNGSRHAGFTALHSLAHIVALNEAAGADHPQKSMFQSWEEQIPKDLSTWAATNRHVLSFFSEQLKGIPSGIKSGSKIEESI